MRTAVAVLAILALFVAAMYGGLFLLILVFGS